MSATDRGAALRRTLRSIQRPDPQTWYGDLDPRSWVGVTRTAWRLGLAPGDLRRAVTLVRQGRRDGRIIASMPRSGLNWLRTMVASALSETGGDGGGVSYAAGRNITGDAEWLVAGPRQVWQTAPAGLLTQVRDETGDRRAPRPFFVTHFPLGGRPLVTVGSRPVVLARDPVACGESMLRKRGLERAETDPAFRRAVLRRIRVWFDHWDAAVASPESTPLVLRYEDLREDPGAGVRSVLDHWDLEVDDATVHSAVERCSWERMEALVPTADVATNARISLVRTPMSPSLRAELEETCVGLGAVLGY